jgi:F0F1-type ATP synthase assembly protein I
MAEPKKKLSLNIGLVIIGSELTAMTLAGVLLDVLTETKGLWTIGFTLLGMVSAVVLAWMLLKQEKAGSAP